MSKDEALRDLLDAVEAAIKAGDWKVDGACDPDLAIRRAKQACSPPEQVKTVQALTDQCAALVWERDELKKQLQRYERNGVTCQTYGHRVDSSCSECNVHENYTTPQQRKPLADEEKQYFKALGLVGIDIIEAKLKEKNT